MFRRIKARLNAWLDDEPVKDEAFYRAEAIRRARKAISIPRR